MTVPENFLLTNPLAGQLYDKVKDLPLIDWHNHLPVKDFAHNRHFPDLTDLWIVSDPYKHRAMRICGIKEQLITGSSSPYEKFVAWSHVLPRLVGNPLYDWSSLELLRVFNIDEDLTPATAEKIWKHTNNLLKKEQYSACGLLEQFHIEYAAPCIQLGDSLEDFFQVKNIVPSLRGDDLLDFTNPVFSGTATLAELRLKLSVEINKLHDASCRFADHALDHGFSYIPDDGKNEARFISMKQGRLSADDSAALSCEILRILGTLYTEKGWTLQLHTGALRNTSTRLRMIAGPAGGYAAIGNRYDIESLVALLDDLEKRMGKLPGVILYTLNPADYAAFAVLSGSFSGDGEAGKIMPGPAWWYCDHIHGMKDCFENLATYSVLSLFPGMTTDSRNILSFVRHEYFRRVFCNYLAEKAAKTEFPDNVDLLGDLAEKVCYFNAETMIQ